MASSLRWLGFRRTQRPSHQVRQLLNITTTVRWVGLVAAGIIGVVAPPRASFVFVLLILAVGAYNTWSMLAARRASDASLLRVARTAALFDMIGCLIFLAIFTDLPGGSQSAFYVPILIEAVAIDGVDGAITGLIIFVFGIVGIQAGGAIFGHHVFAWTVVLVWGLIMLVVAAALGAVDQIALTPAPSAEHAIEPGAPLPLRPAVRLSPREQEVLRFIAEGYSNAMIAERLHLSETTVKTYVENLLVRLSVRNRAEAVAAASRMRIL